MTQRFSSQRYSASRRSILASASALLAVAPFAAKAAASGVIAGRIAIMDLVNDAGQPTERARALVGQAVTLRGYAAPSSLGAAEVLALTEGSPAPCQLCGTIHDAGPAVLVKPRDTVPGSLSMLSVVEVQGRLHVGDREVRLEDATIQIL